MNYRTLRMANLIREELGKIILKEVEFPEGLITITDVNIDKKFEGALVKVSALPSAIADEVLNILKKRQPHLQYLLLRKLNVKPMPELRFEIDHGIENAADVEKIIIDEEKGNGK